jgi:hypothetical protein
MHEELIPIYGDGDEISVVKKRRFDQLSEHGSKEEALSACSIATVSTTVSSDR